MANRYHIPIVVTTDNEMTKEETVQYVESVLTELEQVEEVYRAYTEDTGLDDAEAERLLDMLERIEDGDISSAIDAIDTISEED